MEVLKEVLKFLSGKKNVINGCIGLVIAYCAVKGIFGEAETVLFGGLNVLIFGGASFLTNELIYKDKNVQQ